MLSFDVPPAYVETVIRSIPDLIAGVIKIPPAETTLMPPKEYSYEELVCTDLDRKNVGYIISTMAEHGKLKLLFSYKSELEQRGLEINHMHPLKLLAVVFSDPYLKECMRQIHTDYFKWDGFLNGQGGGLVQSLERHASQGKIDPYLTAFATEVGADPEVLQGYAKSSDWENMVRYLLKI